MTLSQANALMVARIECEAEWEALGPKPAAWRVLARWRWQRKYDAVGERYDEERLRVWVQR